MTNLSDIHLGKLYVTAVDFTKAYDFVRRNALIETSKEYRVHPNLRELIAAMYTDDTTAVKIGIDEEIKMSVSSSIKKGCVASTTLLKIITCTIITDQLKKEGEFQDEFFKLSVLFFADDCLLISRTQEEML